MKIISLSLLIFLYLIPVISIVDPIDKIAELIRQGNAHELAVLFAPSIDVSILGEENTFSKAQAEVALDKFFSENKPKTAKIVHRVSSNPKYQFGVLALTTDKGLYRVAFTLKEVDGNLMIIELRIETEKTK